MSLIRYTQHCSKCGAARRCRVHFGRQKRVVGYLCSACDFVYIIKLYEGGPMTLRLSNAISWYGKIQEFK
jgi:hypothetical protein